MDYFDSAITKAKDVFDVAISKTDKIVSTQKYNLEIASLKHKRSKDLENLGVIYFKSLNGVVTDEEETKVLTDSIKEKNKKIKELREELERLNSLEESVEENEEES